MTALEEEKVEISGETTGEEEVKEESVEVEEAKESEGE